MRYTIQLTRKQFSQITIESDDWRIESVIAGMSQDELAREASESWEDDNLIEIVDFWGEES